MNKWWNRRKRGRNWDIYRMKSAQKMKQHLRLETKPIHLNHVSKQLIKAARGITHKCPLSFSVNKIINSEKGDSYELNSITCWLKSTGICSKGQMIRIILWFWWSHPYQVEATVLMNSSASLAHSRPNNDRVKVDDSTSKLTAAPWRQQTFEWDD